MLNFRERDLGRRGDGKGGKVSWESKVEAVLYLSGWLPRISFPEGGALVGVFRETVV